MVINAVERFAERVAVNCMTIWEGSQEEITKRASAWTPDFDALVAMKIREKYSPPIPPKSA